MKCGEEDATDCPVNKVCQNSKCVERCSENVCVSGKSAYKTCGSDGKYGEETDCSIAHATATECAGAGICKATACEDDYRLDETSGSCVEQSSGGESGGETGSETGGTGE